MRSEENNMSLRHHVLKIDSHGGALKLTILMRMRSVCVCVREREKKKEESEKNENKRKERKNLKEKIPEEEECFM